jgi:hypothetical protein
VGGEVGGKKDGKTKGKMGSQNAEVILAGAWFIARAAWWRGRIRAGWLKVTHFLCLRLLSLLALLD